MAQYAASQSSAISPAETASRCSADNRRIDGATAGRRMDVARVTMVVVAVMIVIGHGGCYNITMTPGSSHPKPFMLRGFSL